MNLRPRNRAQPLIMGCGLDMPPTSPTSPKSADTFMNKCKRFCKRVMSVEGFILGGLLLITAGSYEMVASVLLTSTFQFLVAVTVAGSGLFILFKKEQEEETKGPKPNRHYQ